MKEKIIEINLDNKNEYINLYNDKKLSSLLANYILEESKSTNTKQKIKFIITPKFEMTDSDKSDFVNMLRENFGTDVSEIMNISRKQNLSNLIALLVGIVLLFIYSINFKTIFLREVILIIGWGFIWEAIYNFLFKGIDNRLKITRRKQIIAGKIEFK